MLISESTFEEELHSAVTINRQWRASMIQMNKPITEVIKGFDEAVDQKLTEINSYKPPQTREVMVDHPVIQMGEAAAKSVEAAADTVVEEAQALKQACSDFADDLRKGAKEIADRASHILQKIHKAGKELQAARENYLNGTYNPSGSERHVSVPPHLSPADRQQPGAKTDKALEHGS